MESAAAPAGSASVETEAATSHASIAPTTGCHEDVNATAGQASSTQDQPDTTEEDEYEQERNYEDEDEDEEEEEAEQEGEYAGDESDDGAIMDEETGTCAGQTGEGGVRKVTIVVGSRTYAPSAFIDNIGLRNALGLLKSNPKATFSACDEMHPHNVLTCRALHHTSRGVLVGNRYVRVNMFVDNPARETLLSKPKESLHMAICREEESETHSAASCDKLHLLPDIVFIGIPDLRTAYFTQELHDNLALKNLLKEPWETACGSWCRSFRSHVITTCRSLHYRRDGLYTEKPKPPLRPAALIPALTPQRPPQAGDAKRSGRGRGGRGGRGRGGRGGGRGGRGGGRGGRGTYNPRATTEYVPVPQTLRKPRTAPNANTQAPRSPARGGGGAGGSQPFARGGTQKPAHGAGHTRKTVIEEDPLLLMDTKLQKYLIAFVVILFALVLVMLSNRRD